MFILNHIAQIRFRRRPHTGHAEKIAEQQWVMRSFRSWPSIIHWAHQGAAVRADVLYLPAASAPLTSVSACRLYAKACARVARIRTLLFELIQTTQLSLSNSATHLRRSNGVAGVLPCRIWSFHFPVIFCTASGAWMEAHLETSCRQEAITICSRPCDLDLWPWK